MKLLFVTNNHHKLKEISDLVGEKFDLLSLKDVNLEGDIPETTPTIEGNALQKAAFIYDQFEINCFADDTGLEVEALDGRPGVDSAHYAGPQRDSEANMQQVLEELKGQSNRKARFRTVIALILNGEKHLFEGIVNGTILETPAGDEGFGYDPIFQPEGEERTFAQMPIREKNVISHRGRATAKLVEFLQGL